MKLIRKAAGIVRYADSDQVILARGPRLFLSIDGGCTWKSIGSIPLGLIGSLKAVFPILRRLFRWEVNHVFPTNDGNFLVFAFRRVFGLRRGREATEYSKISGSRPLRVCQLNRDEFYYGEYRSNPKRVPIHIWGTTDGGKSWSIIWQFDSIRHIHGVFHDEYSGWIWITTGDEDSESALWVTKDRFQSVQRVLGGSQSTRVVDLLFMKDYIYFGSDAPEVVNFLYRLPRGSNRAERLHPVYKPVFYGCKAGNRMFFSTVYEPGKVNHSRSVVVWSSLDGVHWEEFITFQKDFLPARLFQYGQVLFPSGPGSPAQLWLTPFATNFDQISFCFETPA